MTPQEINLEARKLGLTLEPAGDKLAVLPKGKCPPEFANTLRQHKSELLQWLSSPPCPGWGAVPPDDLALNPETPRPSIEDRERVIGFVLRQTEDRRCMGNVHDHACNLNCWVLRREDAYYAGPGHWDCALLAYAAARDAARWQTNMTEPELWQFLETTEDVCSQK
jgi:hypothetical protein